MHAIMIYRGQIATESIENFFKNSDVLIPWGGSVPQKT